MGENPINSVTSRIQGMQTGVLREPEVIGSYLFHLRFDSAEAADELVDLFAPTYYDNPEKVIVTTPTRPNMYLLYDPNSSTGLTKKWIQWKYYECIKVWRGYYGKDYYIFGNGKVFSDLPEKID